jgi:eukaryotic-like serine/threonine-protein kinase
MNSFGSIQVREGDVIAGKYRIERLLGVGGMGVVVAARHEQLDQLVAIKFVRGDALDNDEAVERFIREARSAARLKSEHVARVLDVGRLETGAPYMVMEFLDGHDLSQALTRDGPMAVDVAAALIMQACEAVAEAHAAGIVHRDLKPENLFLTRTVGGTPKVKVLDFGVSKSARLGDDPKAKLTRTRTMLGSPLYMAPEQMRSSRDVDARGDVWALGVVLFELLTGRSPFEADTMPELCLKIVSEPPLSLAELRPVVPPSLVEVVERCLQKDKEKRYANAAELALALAPFGAGPVSLFSLRAPGSVVAAGAPSSPFVPPPGVSSSGGPPRIASIPAAWGTEGRRESQQAPPKRNHGVIWAGLALFVTVAAVALLAFRRPGASSSPAVASSPPPPFSSEVAAVVPLPTAVLSDLPAVVESPGASSAAVEALPSASAPKSAPTPATPLRERKASSYPPVARPIATGTRPTATGSDEDIPSLR